MRAGRRLTKIACPSPSAGLKKIKYVKARIVEKLQLWKNATFFGEFCVFFCMEVIMLKCFDWDWMLMVFIGTNYVILNEILESNECFVLNYSVKFFNSINVKYEILYSAAVSELKCKYFRNEIFILQYSRYPRFCE